MNKITELEEKVSFYEAKISYLENYISKTEFKIQNYDSDHEIITRVEINEVCKQGINDYIFMGVILSILILCVNVISNNSGLALAASICIVLLTVAGANVIQKKVYISNLRKASQSDRKVFLMRIFNQRIKKCRSDIEFTNNFITSLEKDIDALKKERQYS